MFQFLRRATWFGVYSIIVFGLASAAAWLGFTLLKTKDTLGQPTVDVMGFVVQFAGGCFGGSLVLSREL